MFQELDEGTRNKLMEIAQSNALTDTNIRDIIREDFFNTLRETGKISDALFTLSERYQKSERTIRRIVKI